MIKPFSITHQVRHFLVIAVLLLMTSALASAQTTMFTYQGRLQDTGTPANGTYDFQFTLWRDASDVTQLPPPTPVTRTSVLVTGGIFTVQLDFGANAFTGADQFLEIGVRPAGSASAYTRLLPRQQITSTPYAVRSANATTAETATTATNATQLGNVAASSYVQTSDSRLSDSRQPTAGSTNYIQNTTPGSGTNFNISGNGTTGGTLSANAVNAATQYSIGGSRVLSVTGRNNTFAGVNAGQSNATGFSNAFFGTGAGENNMGGSGNSFFGAFAHTQGNLDIFNATAIGAGAEVAQSNSLVLGDTAVNVGIGTTAPLAKLDVRGDVFVGLSAKPDNTTTPGNNIYVADDGTLADPRNSFRIDSFNNIFYFVARSGANSRSGTEILFRTATPGGGEINSVVIDEIGDMEVARNMLVTGNVCAANIPCNSDARLKQNVAPLSYGLREVLRLRPVKWQWKDTTTMQPNVGLIAQEVEPVMPELVLRGSDAKEPLGLNYMGLIPVLIKGTQEQQVQIDEQRRQINQQQSQIKQAENQMKLQQNEIEALKKLLSGSSRRRDVQTKGLSGVALNKRSMPWKTTSLSRSAHGSGCKRAR